MISVIGLLLCFNRQHLTKRVHFILTRWRQLSGMCAQKISMRKHISRDFVEKLQQHIDYWWDFQIQSLFPSFWYAKYISFNIFIGNKRNGTS